MEDVFYRQCFFFFTFFLSPGLKYSPSKGGFFWPDDKALDYNSWNPGEPRFGLDCSVMLNRKGWGTERCDMERSFICKKGELLLEVYWSFPLLVKSRKER